MLDKFPLLRDKETMEISRDLIITSIASVQIVSQIELGDQLLPISRTTKVRRVYLQT